MTATASVTISGNVTGAPTGSRNIGPITVSSAAANGTVQQVVLQAGTNTITVPVSPNTTGVVITLPATNTSIVTLKGVAGDTGIAIGKTTTFVLMWDPTAPPASFVLTSVATQTGLATELSFF